MRPPDLSNGQGTRKRSLPPPTSTAGVPLYPRPCAAALLLLGHATKLRIAPSAVPKTLRSATGRGQEHLPILRHEHKADSGESRLKKSPCGSSWQQMLRRNMVYFGATRDTVAPLYANVES